MKKILIPSLLITFYLVLSLVAAPVMASSQAEISPTLTSPQPALTQPDPANIITISQMGLQEEGSLQGPFDTLSLKFSLPTEWKIGSGAELRLHVSTSLSVVMFTQNQFNMDTMIAGGLGVFLNGVQLDNSQLHGNSDQILQLFVPENALDSTSGRELNELKITWNARSACSYNLASSVQIHLDSMFILPHQNQPIQTNLENFPAPIYLENPVLPSGILLIVPDQPSQAELQAAFRIAASLGRMTGGGVDISMLPNAMVDDKLKKSNHVIAIGKSGTFDLLKDLTQASSPDEGIVQLNVSPWNSARGLLAVSGGSDQAVDKAALAVSSGRLLSTEKNNVAIIRDVAPQSPPAAFREDQTFSDMGEEKISFTQFGSNKKQINFFIPPGLTINPESYLEISFNHSELIDYLGSGIVVRLNGTPIGSARLSDTTAPASRARMIIPVSALIPGENSIELQVDIQPRNVCADPTNESLWITIFPDSVLHLPLDTQTGGIPLSQKISSYPLPFTSNSELADTALIISSSDPDGWNIASRVIYYLGSKTRGSMSSLEVYYSNAVPQTTLESRHLLILGTPGQLPILDALSSSLPATFGPGNELSPTVKTRISYNFPPGAALGYLEVAASPLAADKSVLLILGSNSDGLKAAADAVINPVSRAKMNGVFAIVQGKKVMIQDISLLSLPEGTLQPGLIQGTPSVKSTPSAPGTQPYLASAGQPVWLLPSLILSLILAIGMIFWQVSKFFRRNKK